MELTSGTKLGPYMIQSPLGVGGMGEVYKALDTRLDRAVAIKVLPEHLARDADRLRRFEQEARTIAALNHPNILALYDVGTYDGATYLVSEYLEGNTLRERLSAGAVTVRRATEYAAQIAHGLAAAHGKGIVHRDLKPENIFVTRDDRVKILDFGLAKLVQPEAESDTVTTPAVTTPGLVMGTMGYMSPEQVRGQAADHRTDIFAFGAILYEMLSGRRAFRHETSPETMTAILKEDPPALTTANPNVPPALERIVGRCLEKDSERRFQSAKDLAFALESISSGTGATIALAPPAKERTRLVRVLAATAAILLVGALAGYFTARRTTGATQPVFHQLTRSRGKIGLARFAPDGQTVVFAAAWNGEPTRVFFQRTDGTDFSPLPFPERTELLSVSSAGELAVGLRSVDSYYWMSNGTLARVSLTGGAPREVLDGVQDADWAPDGSGLAITRRIGRDFRLEFPIGKVLYQTPGYISHIRFSAQGDRIAFMDHPYYGDNAGFVSVVDLAGGRKVLTRQWGSEMGLAWSPKGDELWFGAQLRDEPYALRAVDLSGHERLLLSAPANLFLQDVFRDGRVLLATDDRRVDVLVGGSASEQEKDLTWFAESWHQQIASDGRFIVFNAGDYGIYLRKTDGSPVARLGRGQNYLSPDGKWVLSIVPTDDRKLLLIPTGAGETQTIMSNKVHYQSGRWLPDGRQLVVVASNSVGVLGTYLQDVTGGEPKQVSPAEVAAVVVAPDGKSFLGMAADGKYDIYSLDGGAARHVPGMTPEDRPVQWLSDGQTLLVRPRTGIPLPVSELDLASGRRKLWKQFDVPDKIGLTSIPFLDVTRDRSHYVYAAGRDFSVLYLAEGIK